VAATGTARARMRDARGGWVVLQASRLIAGEDPGQMVITVEPLTDRQLMDLQFTALALTPRERDVCLEVLAGRSTADIAARLSISANTVQDHLKAVFRKAGVNSRGELAARLRTGV
jgi:DNA-binding CsgD family transcriptional regulator